MNEDARPSDPLPPGPEFEAGSSARDSLLGRCWTLIVAPGQASMAIAARPAWALAALVLFLVSAAFSAVTLHIVVPEQIEMSLENTISEEQVSVQRERMEEMRTPSTGARIGWGVLGGLGVVLFGLILPGAIFHGFFKLSAGQGNLAQSLGVVAWASLVTTTVKYVLALPLILSKGTMHGVGTGLVLLVPDEPLNSPLYVALNLFGDIFVWWQIALFAIGFAVVHVMPLRRAATVTVALAVLLGIIVVGFQFITSRLGG